MLAFFRLACKGGPPLLAKFYSPNGSPRSIEDKSKTKERTVEKLAGTPGTVSNILWHFTGGPIWDCKLKRQLTQNKSPAEAYKNLKSILKSSELRLGAYKEIIRVSLPPLKVRNRKDETRRVEREPVDFESSTVCCLSDIPPPHLGYHGRRYGKFAIGFHRLAVVKAGFNPVFYTLQDTPIIRSIWKGVRALNRVDLKAIRNAAALINGATGLPEFYDADTSEITNQVTEIEEEADFIDKQFSTARNCLADFTALVKTFSQSEFKSIYCEREWRCTQPFRFTHEDIAMVVVPKRVGRERYFHRFIHKSRIGRKLPREIPIIAWEDLVET